MAVLSLLCVTASALLLLVGIPLSTYYALKLIFLIDASARLDIEEPNKNSFVEFLKAILGASLPDARQERAREAMFYWSKRLALGLVLSIPAVYWYPDV